MTDDARCILGRHDDAYNDKKNGRSRIKFVTIKSRIERSPNSAGANYADDSGFPKINVQTIDRQANGSRPHLWSNGKVEPLQPAGSSRLDSLRLSRIDRFNVFRQKFGVKTEGGECERDDTGERTKTE